MIDLPYFRQDPDSKKKVVGILAHVWPLELHRTPEDEQEGPLETSGDHGGDHGAQIWKLLGPL